MAFGCILTVPFMLLLLLEASRILEWDFLSTTNDIRYSFV